MDRLAQKDTPPGKQDADFGSTVSTMMLHSQLSSWGNCRAEQALVKCCESAQQVGPGELDDLAASLSTVKVSLQDTTRCTSNQPRWCTCTVRTAMCRASQPECCIWAHSSHTLPGMAQHMRASCCKLSSLSLNTAAILGSHARHCKLTTVLLVKLQWHVKQHDTEV